MRHEQLKGFSALAKSRREVKGSVRSSTVLLFNQCLEFYVSSGKQTFKHQSHSVYQSRPQDVNIQTKIILIVQKIKILGLKVVLFL